MQSSVHDQSAKFGEWVWDLRFSHSALRCIQMTNGSLDTLAKDLLSNVGPEGLATPLSLDRGVLLVWAGQSWCERKLTLKKTKQRLYAMSEKARSLLITWAVADFLTALVCLSGEQVAQLPPEDGDDE